MVLGLLHISNADLFNTDQKDTDLSTTSSYLDLAPLYGSNQDQQNAVRTMSDGKLKPDCFSDIRILGFPPGVGVLLISFNRFHNYIVGEMANINEGGRFDMPNLTSIKAMLSALHPNWTDKQLTEAGEKTYNAAILKRDNDLFQTAKLYSP
jgi:linoleate 8R-lipoxygenase/9,12-octadecadienoate 8-hydroperoxide 8R-isomerase